MLNEALKKVVAGGSLTEQESADLVNAIAVGENNIAAAGLLTAMSMRGGQAAPMQKLRYASMMSRQRVS